MTGIEGATWKHLRVSTLSHNEKCLGTICPYLEEVVIQSQLADLVAEVPVERDYMCERLAS